MPSHPVFPPIAALAATTLLAACSQGHMGPAAPGKAAGQDAPGSTKAWTANGATACARFLKPEVTSALLTHPAGHPKTLSEQSCAYETDDHSGSIGITLSGAGPDAFDHYQQFLVDPQPLPGVGDKASRSVTGIDAVKGSDRTCTIDAVGPPGATKLTGAALAQKLGAVCNALFALP